VRATGAEAAAIEADVRRGVPLPPRDARLREDAGDAPDAEVFPPPEGARVRRIDRATWRETEGLP
jgi:hypothetical protein